MTEFEEWFGTEEEHQAEMAKAVERDRLMEAECRGGSRLRCACGAPSLFTHEKYGPLCAPCGYHYAN